MPAASCPRCCNTVNPSKSSWLTCRRVHGCMQWVVGEYRQLVCSPSRPFQCQSQSQSITIIISYCLFDNSTHTLTFAPSSANNKPIMPHMIRWNGLQDWFDCCCFSFRALPHCYVCLMGANAKRHHMWWCVVHMYLRVVHQILGVLHRIYVYIFCWFRERVSLYSGLLGVFLFHPRESQDTYMKWMAGCMGCEIWTRGWTDRNCDVSLTTTETSF
jgi:hypothetical protein